MLLSIYTVAVVTASLCRCSLAAPTLRDEKTSSAGLDAKKTQWQEENRGNLRDVQEPSALAVGRQQRRDLVIDPKNVQWQKREERPKYFHEPGGDSNLGHYDARYFHSIVSDEERTNTQSQMIRAYLDFFREEGLDTWLAHGTLLGWWWNGKRFPWDFDLDTQVSDATLKRLGEKYNQTRHTSKSLIDGSQREYLLDVNAQIDERDRGNGNNVIDARWIDTSNGLFIDITGLSETNPADNPGMWHCKNYHFYKVTQLFPMRATMFEGVEAKVPYAYDKILTEEYTEKALVDTEFNGHVWDSQQRLWVKNEETLRREAEEREKKEYMEHKLAYEKAKLD